LPDFRRPKVRPSVTVPLDVLEDPEPLIVGAWVVIIPQKPEAAVAVFVHQTVDRFSDSIRHVVHLG